MVVWVLNNQSLGQRLCRCIIRGYSQTNSQINLWSASGIQCMTLCTKQTMQNAHSYWNGRLESVCSWHEHFALSVSYSVMLYAWSTQRLIRLFICEYPCIIHLYILWPRDWLFETQTIINPVTCYLTQVFSQCLGAWLPCSYRQVDTLLCWLAVLRPSYLLMCISSYCYIVIWLVISQLAMYGEF